MYLFLSIVSFFWDFDNFLFNVKEFFYELVLDLLIGINNSILYLLVSSDNCVFNLLICTDNSVLDLCLLWFKSCHDYLFRMCMLLQISHYACAFRQDIPRIQAGTHILPSTRIVRYQDLRPDWRMFLFLCWPLSLFCMSQLLLSRLFLLYNDDDSVSSVSVYPDGVCIVLR